MQNSKLENNEKKGDNFCILIFDFWFLALTEGNAHLA